MSIITVGFPMGSTRRGDWKGGKCEERKSQIGFPGYTYALEIAYFGSPGPPIGGHGDRSYPPLPESQMPEI